MEIKVKDSVIEIEPNSKPYLLKRIVADLFDIGVLFLVWFSINLGFFNSKLANTYNNYVQVQSKIKDEAMLDSGYGEIRYIEEGDSTNGYIVYKDELNNKEYIVVKKSAPSVDETQKYAETINNSQAYKDAVFGANIHRYVISGFACFISEIAFFLVVPLLNKKRATFGQMLMGISLFSLRFEKYAKWYHILIRFLWLFIFESCLLYLISGIYTFLLVPVIDLIVMLLSKNTNRVLRDYISKTMLIENKSYLPINEI